MITSVAIAGLFSLLDADLTEELVIKDYLIAGFHYNSGLAWDSKLRKKIVLLDADIARTKSKPLWIMKLWSRSTIRKSEQQGRRFDSRVDNRPAGTTKLYRDRYAQCEVQLAYVSNSITLIEHIEEAMLARDIRTSYTVDFGTCRDGAYAAAFADEDPFTVDIMEFTTDGLDKDDTSQYGPIVSLTSTAIIHYPIIIPTVLDHKLITDIHLTVEMESR